ncbi:MAG: hypothetical protein IJZ38_06920 [Bacteroides sp.]|nr:hypothetical protein [Bacteroides sp.]
MENLKVGDIVCINIAEDIQIVITHIKDDSFQGVYYNSLTHEFNTTPMLPINLAKTKDE